MPYRGSCCNADDLVVIAETEDDLIKRLNEWIAENEGDVQDGPRKATMFDCLCL